MRLKLFEVITIFSLMLLFIVNNTVSSFSSQVFINRNTISMGKWEENNSSRDFSSDEKSKNGEEGLLSSPTLEVSLANDLKGLSFKVLNINNFKKLIYSLHYDADQSPQGIVGEIKLETQEEYVKDNIIFGTCSSGGTCAYQTGIKDIKLTVTLIGENANLITLEKVLLQ